VKIKTELPLVVLTYPGHFLLTALTIQSYLTYHTPTEIVVVADDIGPYAWNSYLKDCQDLYWTDVIPFSQISETKKFNNGWIRQQIAKLHLDQVIAADSWFFTDGDIVFLHSVDPSHVPYSVPYYNEVTRQQNEYVNELLGIDAGICVDHQQVCVSNPPFRAMQTSVLQELRQHAGEKLTTTGIGMSEWELIENFKQHIKGEQLNLVKYAPHRLNDPDADLNYFDHQFLTCYGTDRELGRDWFSGQRVYTTDRIWQILSEIQR
jgi:hypothetical protein